MAAAAAAAAGVSTSFPPQPLPSSFRRASAMSTRPLLLRRRLRRLAVAAGASTSVWTPAPLAVVSPATSDGSLFHVAVDLADAPELLASHTSAGQYLQLRLSPAGGTKPAFLAIASPPPPPGARCFEFLVKRVPGSTAERLCELRDGDVVELGGVMGKGFQLERISPPAAAATVLIFATGSGISAIRSFIESGFDASERADVRLFYGARSLKTMAYQDRFKSWESSGIKIIPVLSQPDKTWKGEQGYVQRAFLSSKQIEDPSSIGAVLCGHKEMLEEITSALLIDGVPSDKILKNF